MTDYRFLLSGLCVYDIKSDPLIEGFMKLSDGAESAAEGYAQIVRTLLSAGKDIGAYLTALLCRTGLPEAILANKASDKYAKLAVASDLNALVQLADIKPAQLKKELSAQYGKSFSSLPNYSSKGAGENFNGKFFVSYALKNGSGVFSQSRTFSWSNHALEPVDCAGAIPFNELQGYELQRHRIYENTEFFCKGLPACNALLYGDRGTGKSATIRALSGEFDNLRMIDLPKTALDELPELFGILARNGLRFIVTIDDLSFAENDDRFNALKAALEGSLSSKPENVLIYATTNRRKLIKDGERPNDVSRSDSIDESMSLADRFGLFVTFARPDKQDYLERIAVGRERLGLSYDDDELEKAANRFAARRGGFSARIAEQFLGWAKARDESGLDLND